ncbi:AsmA family protein [Vibrio sp. ZSDE26]|uniref:AsmA family protein n=1 Tax=Vibrio amylolyticus TaxID=2847292 RepID=A0A9X1XJM6_9VIBR|nr:AsmA family protein [Vibrio amylolyticus]MCK6263325.1 AsmA family protein [Vibrio amylolyticus]
MKKLLTILLILLLITIALITSVYALSQTRYAAPASNQLLSYWLGDKVQFEKVTYNAPFHLSLQGVSYNAESQQSDQTTYIPQVDIWLNKQPYQQGKWVLDSILIDGLSLQQLDSYFHWQESVTLHQLALNNLDLSVDDVIARGVNVQVKEPVWLGDNQIIPFGEIQLSAEQLYYHGEAFNQLLINSDYKAKDSTVYGASFEWRGADISGQAEQYDHGWSLINVTLNKLNLSHLEKFSEFSAKLLPIVKNISHINSLDILNSHFSSSTIQATNLDASVENLSLFPTSEESVSQWLWQQDNASISFNAESVAYLEQLFVSPMAKLRLESNKWVISEFDSDFHQGRIQLSGELSPTTTKLDWLRATGLKLTEAPQQTLDLLWAYLEQQEVINIGQLDILRSQIIQIEQAPFWQMSGLNMTGSNLELKRNHTLGLWNGQVELSANSLSYDDLIGTQAVLNSNASDGAWELERLFIPLESGYVDASGFWEIGKLSQPWQLVAHGDGLPLNLIHQTASLPIELDGTLEFDMNAHGLLGSKEMLEHSLTGSLNASIRDADFTYKKANGYGSAQLQTIVQPFSISELGVQSDRGRVTIAETKVNGTDMSGEVQGFIDLVMPKQGNIKLSIEQECQQLNFDLLKGTTTSHHRCP